MTPLLSTLDKVLYAVFSPFAALPWGVSIALSSLLFSLVFVFAYRGVSSQKQIKAARNSIRTALLEAVVFRRDAVVCIKAQGALFLGGLRYLMWALIPITILLIPGAVLLSRMYLALGVEPLQAGTTFLVHGRVVNPATISSLEISGNESLTVGPMVRSATDGSFVARIKVNPKASTDAKLEVRGGSQPTSNPMPILVAGSRMIPKEISSRATFGSLLLPAGQFEVSKDGPVSSMWVEYPERMVSLFGLQISWLVLFVILTLVWGYSVAKTFGIAL